MPPTYVDLGKPARDVFTKGYGECGTEWPFRSQTGLACEGFWISHLERPGQPSVRTSMSGAKAKLPTARKAAWVVHPGGAGSRCCRQVGILVASPRREQLCRCCCSGM